MKLSAAGNTEVPAYLALKELGFAISVSGISGGEQLWSAQREDLVLNGAGPLELLALVKLVECRGESWHASDNEIEDFVNKYC